MKILWCSWKDRDHPLSGGAEVFTHEVASRLVRAGHEVHLACAAVPDAPAETCVDGVHIHRRGGPLVGCYRGARLFYERTADHWDLVVDEINTRPFNAPMWVRDTPVLAVAYQLAAEVWQAEAPLPVAVAGRYLLEPLWWSRYRSTPVLAPSESSAESFRALGVRDVRVVAPGATWPERPDVERAGVETLVSLGRVSAMKRPLDLVRAHQLLRRWRPDARLRFLGDGPDRAALERTVAGMPGVAVLGHVDDATKAAELASAWALVTASVREGWGLMVSEAAAMGTFTVGYRVPGLVDSITACGGVLCDPDPESLARALHEHLDRLALGRPPGTGTRSWDDVADAVESVARELVAGSARRSVAEGSAP